MASQYTRRSFLHIAGAAGAAVALDGCVSTQPNRGSETNTSSSRTRTLRIAHLTDLHVSSGRGAPLLAAACLRHVHNLPDRPDVIFTGGDSILDALNHTEEDVRSQWEVWTTLFRKHCTLPVHSCLGNHDVWGWNKKDSHTTGTEPLYGKEWARQIFGVESHYRSFPLGGWHIVFLDSTVFDGGTMYYAALDDTQFAWLESDLKSVDPRTPILIVSHIPILSAAVFYDGDNAKADWIIPRAWMHIDSARIKDLFINRPNVRLCLSGHVHLQDRVLYNGVTYVCDGSVSGAVWKGPYHQCNPGYGIVDLYDDGTFEHQYVEYLRVPDNQQHSGASEVLRPERSLAG